ncbi:hypothetical protein [Cellulosilyticum lentocellum]|uniref:Uncharacterized protein n=1 Tax=Cellulosilyticum lentocellum (strain ATCC 49066 / DSM 5427 / NCIMB 11756 / RHM5) TaxID=642492 RepID=F2JPI8_CELLD|nr:hypothetical protein [Cellulosilyticum lentocellum]ADZ82536.1 hypothetical protein Clole_0803 [Cellulosilyticum lentocellum DSM 5427]
MSDYKYTLITSQYWHSYHMFIVAFNEESFIEQAKNMSRELIEYKGPSTRDYLGDLEYNYETPEIRQRYNINEQGDIYIQNFINLSVALRWMKKYIGEEDNASKGYKKKEIKKDIEEHHRFEKVKEIVEKYFEIL